MSDLELEARALARCADHAVRVGDREAGAALIAKLYSVLDCCFGDHDSCGELRPLH